MTKRVCDICGGSLVLETNRSYYEPMGEGWESWNQIVAKQNVPPSIRASVKLEWSGRSDHPSTYPAEVCDDCYRGIMISFHEQIFKKEPQPCPQATDSEPK